MLTLKINKLKKKPIAKFQTTDYNRNIKLDSNNATIFNPISRDVIGI